MEEIEATELDGLLSQLEEDIGFSTPVSARSADSRENTLYESALHDNTWLVEENNSSADLTFIESSGQETLPDEVSGLQKEMAFLHHRMEAIKEKLSSQEKVETKSNESLRRVSQIKKMIDSPIDFTASNSPQSELDVQSSQIEDHLSDDENEIGLSIVHGSETSFSSTDFSRPNNVSKYNPDQFVAIRCLREKGRNISKNLENQLQGPVHDYFDPFFGIRVTNPKISSTSFQGYLGGRQKVRLSQMSKTITSVNWDDYVTMGILVDISPRKKTITGNDYLIWKLCDLRDCQAIVAVFLFNSKCIDQFWKLVPGNVVALLNAGVLPSQGQNQKNGGLTLKIDNPQKILEIGISPDFAFCKSSKRSDGKRCTNVVNKSQSDVCDFHVVSASKKFAAKRGEFHLNTNVPPKKFEPPLQTGLYTVAAPKLSSPLLSQSSGCKTGQRRKYEQTTSLLQRVSNNIKAAQVLDSVRTQVKAEAEQLNVKDPSLQEHEIMQTCAADVSTAELDTKDKDAFVELLSNPSAGSRNLLKQIAVQNTTKRAPIATYRPTKRGGIVTNSVAPNLLTSGSTSRITCQQFLSSHFQRKNVTNQKMDMAKAKAVAVLRRSSSQPCVKSKAPPLSAKVNKVPQVELVVEGEPASKKSKLGDINMSTEDIKKLLSLRSKHDGELVKDESARQATYFKVLESKEKAENRVAEIKELSCKVVTCKECNYTWHSQSDLCVKLRHTVFWHQALRRFFKCKDCSKRTIAYAKYPTERCACGSTTFDRTTMKEEKVIKTTTERLKIRGDEETFLN